MTRLTFVIFSILGLSCMEEEPEIGSNFFDEVSFEIVSRDTLTVDLYTVLFDDVVTLSPERLLVGMAEHVELGRVEAQAYFQIIPDLEYDADDLKDGEFQDAFLTLVYDGYFYGDTLANAEIHVYEVNSEIELDDDHMLYNRSFFEVKEDADGQPESLGSYSFVPRPHTLDSIEIPIDRTLATAIFEYLKSDDIIADDFLDSLRGLKVLSLTEGAIVGFQATPTLKLNYLDKSESPSVERTLNIGSSTTEIQFNHIESTGLEGMFTDEDEDVLSSESTGNKAYIQSGLGLAIRVELPYLKDLLSADEAPLIDEVKLELVFENTVPNEAYMLDAGLVVTKVDGKNNVLLEYTMVPELALDIEFDEERKFVIDITAFVEEQLSVDTPENDEALMIQFPDEYRSSSLNHLIVSDQNQNNQSSKIIINTLNIK